MGCDKSLYILHGAWHQAPTDQEWRFFTSSQCCTGTSLSFRQAMQDFLSGNAWRRQSLSSYHPWWSYIYWYIYIYIYNINVIFAWTSTLPIWLPGLNKLHESLGTFVRYSLFLPYWVSHQPMNLVQIGRSHAVNTPKILQGCNGLKMFQSFCGNHLWSKNDTNYH